MKIQGSLEQLRSNVRLDTIALTNNKSVGVTAEDPSGTITGTSTIPSGAGFVTVTSADANYIVTLPTPVLGQVIHIMVGANGYELRSSDPATISINGGDGAAVESAVATNVLVRVVCVDATSWVSNTFAADGTEAKLAKAA